MSSTLDNLLTTFKKSPAEIKLISTILQQLLNRKQSEQTKQRVTRQLLIIIIKIQNKLDHVKQVQTCRYLSNVKVKMMEVIMHCLIESQDQAQWFQIIRQLSASSKNKAKIVQVILEYLQNQQNKCNFNELRSGELLYFTLKQINQQYINKNLIQVLHFLLQIEHFTTLVFKEATTTADFIFQMKKLYQEVLISSLRLLQQLSIEQQISIYNKLGDKVFSKLASPLVLSQFFIKKLIDTQQNPMIQIQVLSCLFILVGKYGLELQKFYQNLEHIIEKKRPSKISLFRLKNSKRFLKLVEAAMRSSKVPFKTILNLCRLLLRAIPNQRSQFAFWAISFFVNLVKKHRQLQSNLFEFPEIQALKYHYSPRVRNLVKELQKKLNKAEYLDIEDFTKISCKRLCDQKLQQIKEKIENCEQEVEFKKPRFIQEL